VPIKTWVAAGIALAGCLVLALGPATIETSGSLFVPAPFRFAGELATFGSAICFTAHILLIDHFGPRSDTMQLTAVMFLVVGIGSLGLALGLGALPLHTPASLAALSRNPTWFRALLTLIVLCSALAMWLMNRVQPELSPARAAVLYTLEPVFAALFSILLGQERLAVKTWLGGALIIGAALFSTAPSLRIFPRR